MRTHYCGEVTSKFIGKTVELCGWVHRRRDHGGVVFVDLRDRTGLVQVVFHPDQADVFKVAEKLRSEFVVRVVGVVNARPEGTVNKDLSTGEIEVSVKSLEILNESLTPPFMLDDHQKINEDTRLRYRYIDLRRPEMAARSNNY